VFALLERQRFDVLALKVRDEDDARDIADALGEVRLPPHGILVGGAGVRLLTLNTRAEGIWRFVPRPLPAEEVSRLVDVSISSGIYESAHDNGNGSAIEEVDMEETIEAAASAVYALAKRRRQRFSTVVDADGQRMRTDPGRLRRALVALLRLVVTLAPRSAHVAVEARAGKDEWTVRIAASPARAGARAFVHLADHLGDETHALNAVSRDVHLLGGLLWVELMGPSALALCLTLPLPPEGQLSESA
jgi:signal transduction histidine kinase